MVQLKPETASALNPEVLAALVQAFYARVRADAVLGAMFNSAIAADHWPDHLGRMADFWSSVMLASGRYHGNPMAAHLKHRDAITPDMFDRWLALWSQTASEILPERDAQAVIAKASRIAESLRLALFFRLPLAARKPPDPHSPRSQSHGPNS